MPGHMETPPPKGCNAIFVGSTFEPIESTQHAKVKKKKLYGVRVPPWDVGQRC